MRPALFLGINVAVAGGLLAWLLSRHGGPALALLGAQPSLLALAGAAAAAAAAFVGLALRWRMLLRGLGTGPGLGRLLAFRAAGQAVSTIVPSARLGGDPLRAWLLATTATPAPAAIASVAVDRALEMGSSAGFAVLFALVLLQQGVPALHGPIVSGLLGAAAVVVGLAVTGRRLRQHAGLVTALLRGTGLERLRAVQERMAVLGDAEAAAAGLIEQHRRLVRAFLVGVAVNLLTPLEYWLLLSAFGLPSGAVAVVAAIFATGAAHSMPVPAGVGVLEGSQVWLFGLLGHPADVGLAVGLAVRLRELAWVAPGLLVLLFSMLGSARAPARAAAATDS